MKLSGIAASDGIAIGKVFRLETAELFIPETKITNAKEEIKRLHVAVEKSVKQLEKIRVKTAKKLDEEHAMIFDAHIQIASDTEIFKQVEDIIHNDSVNAAHAYKSVTEMFAQMFESMDNEYMQERAADVRDVARRILANFLNVELSDPTMIDEEVIVVANDLTPSDTAQLSKEYTLGFITNIGGRTSHSAIMARSLEIPAIVGTKTIMDDVQNGDVVILDGLSGDVIINPSKDDIKKYESKKEEFKAQIALLARLVDEPSITKDGQTVELAANIGSPEDVESVLKNGAEGIGLYRTEFLYMNNNDFPTEDEQYVAYKMVLESMKDQKVVIRTLDIGGDKHLDYLHMDHELNPFLGHRALRLCLDEVDLFKTQLRALLRAGVYGDLHIMFPMVALIDELRQAKVLLEECKNELKAEGIDYSDDVKVGIMVEIPAVAMLADVFAKEVDFFSIGTNDLIQYSFAADRMNEKVSYLYQPYNPSLLRLIKNVIDASHEAGIWTGMCGEMAGDKLAAPILLGLGLDEFSMSATSVLQIRDLFSRLSKDKMTEMANNCLQMASQEEVYAYVEQTIKELDNE